MRDVRLGVLGAIFLASAGLMACDRGPDTPAAVADFSCPEGEFVTGRADGNWTCGPGIRGRKGKSARTAGPFESVQRRVRGKDVFIDAAAFQRATAAASNIWVGGGLKTPKQGAGVVVKRPRRGSLYSVLGFRGVERVVAINGLKVADVAAFKEALSRLMKGDAGSSFTIDVKRKKGTITRTIRFLGGAEWEAKVKESPFGLQFGGRRGRPGGFGRSGAPTDTGSAAAAAAAPTAAPVPDAPAVPSATTP